MIGVISHDAGGAEVLSSWIKENPDNYSLLLGGPAKEIFQKKLYKQYPYINDVADVIGCKQTICSTGWQTDFEKKGILFSLKNSIYTTVFLDHWNFYLERFIYSGQELVPNEIKVPDIESKKIALKQLKCLNITIYKNHYLNQSVDEILNLSRSVIHKKRVFLYLCDPIEDFAREFGIDDDFWGYNEVDALEFFLKNIASKSNSYDEIILRKHPSETYEKYEWALGGKVKFSKNKTLAEDIANADTIFGCETYALVVALKSGKDVFYSIPPGGRKSLIPYSIPYLRDQI